MRESARRVGQRDALLGRQFDECQWFSLALDTALFGQEHVLSCIVQLTNDESLTQFPLFFAVCHASTGEELATYVLHKLKQKKIPLSKLSCVTTDGANNMTGKHNGMVVHLRDMIRAEVGEQNSEFQSIWCLSHRLNLVVRDFESVDHIKNVLKFADWFSSKRKAVAYKNGFLRRSQTIISRKSPSHLRPGGVSTKTF